MNNNLKIILGDYESFVQSHTIEINEKEVIYCITLKRAIISCPECGSRMNIKDYRKCKVMHNMIRSKNTSLILKKRRLVCPQCNKVVKEENPFTEKSHSRLSQTSELEIMNKIKEPTTTFSLVARFFDTVLLKSLKYSISMVRCIDSLYLRLYVLMRSNGDIKDKTNICVLFLILRLWKL